MANLPINIDIKKDGFKISSDVTDLHFGGKYTKKDIYVDLVFSCKDNNVVAELYNFYVLDTGMDYGNNPFTILDFELFGIAGDYNFLLVSNIDFKNINNIKFIEVSVKLKLLDVIETIINNTSVPIPTTIDNFCIDHFTYVNMNEHITRGFAGKFLKNERYISQTYIVKWYDLPSFMYWFIYTINYGSDIFNLNTFIGGQIINSKLILTNGLDISLKDAINYEIKIEAKIVSNSSLFFPLYPSETLYPSEILYPR
jgi:hypothetical protein